MGHAENRAAQYANYSLFASLALRLLARMQAGHVIRGKDDEDGASLLRLAKLMRASRNGAAHVSSLVADDDLAPMSISVGDEIDDYDMIKRLLPDLSSSPARITAWAEESSNILEALRESSWNELGEERQARVCEELVPFLQQLAQLDDVEVESEATDTDPEPVEI